MAKTLLLFRRYIRPPFPGTFWESLISSWGLDEETGTRFDRAGANHLSNSHTVGSTAGIISGAAVFVSANAQLLSIDDNPSLRVSNTDFTFALWARLTSKTANQGFINKMWGGSDREYQLTYESIPDRFRFKVANLANAWTGTIHADALGSPALDTWYFVVAWYNSIADTLNIQVNNGTINSAAYLAGVRASSGPFRLGGYSGSGDLLNGAMDETFFWKRLLAPEERTYLYNGGAGRSWANVYEQRYPNAMLADAGWNIKTLFNKTGTSLARWMVDVDNDGNYELVCNVGDQAHFAAIKQNGTILWQNVVNTVKENGAYYPKIAAGKLFYGGAVSGKIWAINLSNGSLAWTVTKAGLTSLDISDKGLVYGAGTYVGILDYATGVAVSGWPVNVGFHVHEQVIVSGDLDGDGLDEIAMCETDGGRIRVLDHDGSVLWTYTGKQYHSDSMFITDIDPDNPGNELVAMVNEDAHADTNSIATFDRYGNQLHKTYIANAVEGLEMRVGNIGATGKVAYCAEELGIVGVLDGRL